MINNEIDKGVVIGLTSFDSRLRTLSPIIHKNPFKEMKNQFIITLLCLSLIGTVATAQTKKPTTTKPSTTVKSTTPKTTTKTSTTTTTTMPNSKTAPVVVEEKRTTTTTTSSPNQGNSSSTNSSSSTTIQQSSGPSKGNKKTSDPKPDKVATPKPEKVREPRPEKVRSASASSSGGVRFGIRAEATQLYTLRSGGSFDIAPGVNAGIIVNLPLSSAISIQPEVLYSITTLKQSIDANNYGTITRGSVLAPLMLNINLGQGSTKFMLNLGGYGNYLLNASEKAVVGGKTIKDVTADLTNEDKFDYGTAIGIGVKINGKFMIEVRSFYSLKNNADSKVGFGTIGIGYFF